MNASKQFGKILRQAMIKACLSNRQLAERSTLTELYIRDIRSGAESPGFDDIIRLAKETNTTASELMKDVK